MHCPEFVGFAGREFEGREGRESEGRKERRKMASTEGALACDTQGGGGFADDRKCPHRSESGSVASV